MMLPVSYLNYLAPDAKALEAALNRRAAAGWALQWLFGGLAFFRRTERTDLRYGSLDLTTPDRLERLRDALELAS